MTTTTGCKMSRTPLEMRMQPFELESPQEDQAGRVIEERYPTPEWVILLGTTLSIVVDGKNHKLTLTRAQIFRLMASGFESLASMEPGR